MKKEKKPFAQMRCAQSISIVATGDKLGSLNGDTHHKHHSDGSVPLHVKKNRCIWL